MNVKTDLHALSLPEIFVSTVVFLYSYITSNAQETTLSLLLSLTLLQSPDFSVRTILVQVFVFWGKCSY